MSETKKDVLKTDKKVKLVSVMPLRDHKLVQNKYNYDLKKGESCEVAEHFLPALKTEKVIK